MEKIINQIERELKNLEKEKNNLIKNKINIDFKIKQIESKIKKLKEVISNLNNINKNSKNGTKQVSEPGKTAQNRFQSQEKRHKGRLKITKEIGDYIRENAGEIGNIELSKKIKEIFNIEVTSSGVKNYKRKNKIIGCKTGKGRKDYKNIIKKSTNIREKDKESRIFTKEVIEFMKKCSEEEMTSKNACEKSAIEFGHYFSLNSFKKIAGQNKIRFRSIPLNDISHIDPKIIKLVEKNKDQEKYIIRDKIIEELGINLSNKDLNKILNNVNPKIINNKKDEVEEKSVKKEKNIKEIRNDEEDNLESDEELDFLGDEQ